LGEISNLENTIELVKEFDKEIREEEISDMTLP